MLGFPILYFRGMRLKMFQLSGFCCRVYLGFRVEGLGLRAWGMEGLAFRRSGGLLVLFCRVQGFGVLGA